MKRFFLVTMVIGFSACIPAQAQLGGLVYDPTQAAHAIEQIAQGENILQNTIQLAQTSLALLPTGIPNVHRSTERLRRLDFTFHLLAAARDDGKYLRQLRACHGFGQ